MPATEVSDDLHVDQHGLSEAPPGLVLQELPELVRDVVDKLLAVSRRVQVCLVRRLAILLIGLHYIMTLCILAA